jgi:hypothetical protein
MDAERRLAAAAGRVRVAVCMAWAKYSSMYEVHVVDSLEKEVLSLPGFSLINFSDIGLGKVLYTYLGKHKYIPSYVPTHIYRCVCTYSTYMVM